MGQIVHIVGKDEALTAAVLRAVNSPFYGLAGDKTFCQVEHAAHDTDHALIGALMARTWGISQTVCPAIRLHHDHAGLSESGTPRWSPGWSRWAWWPSAPSRCTQRCTQA